MTDSYTSNLELMQDVLAELPDVIENEELILHFLGEAHPESYDLDGIGAVLARLHQSDASQVDAETGKADRSAAMASVTRSLSPNQKCTLCNDRIYASRRFYIQGSRPILVVHFEGPFGKSSAAMDRSQKLYFASEQEDDLFDRMLQRMGLSMQDLHFQQLPACHFVAETSTADDWNERTTNCLTHLEDTIQREDIKLVLVTGPAAILLFGEDGAKKFSESGEVFRLPVLSTEVSAVVLRSPAAILSLEGKTRKAKEQGDEAFQKARSEEIHVKKQILNNLEKAFSVPGLR